MGGIADKMINGEFCACCGVCLEPSEKVYLVANGEAATMPADGSPFLSPVLCEDCTESASDYVKDRKR